jgi:hypothetical protein
MPDSTSTQPYPGNALQYPRPSTPWWGSPRVTIAALAIAVLAAALAIAAWFRPASGPSYNDEQRAAAKTSLCASYKVAHQGVVANTHMANPVPNNPAGQLGVIANARLALVGGGAYLRDQLAAQPAAPADLAKAIDSLANTIEQLGVNYIAGAGDGVQNPLRKDLITEIGQVNDLCK